MGADWPTIGVVVALGALLRRRSAAVGARVDAIYRRLTKAIGDVARLESWIEGKRAGRTVAGDQAGALRGDQAASVL